MESWPSQLCLTWASRSRRPPGFTHPAPPSDSALFAALEFLAAQGPGPSGGDCQPALWFSPSETQSGSLHTHYPAPPVALLDSGHLAPGLQGSTGTAPGTCEMPLQLSCYQWGSGGTEQSGSCRGPQAQTQCPDRCDPALPIHAHGCSPLAAVTQQGSCSDGLPGLPR